MDKEQVLAAAKALLKCDSVRILQPIPDDFMFLIMGEMKNTKNDVGFWSESSDGDTKLKNWDYLDEKVVAKGRTPDELMKDIELYSKVRDMTFEELEKDEETFSKFLNSLAS